MEWVRANSDVDSSHHDGTYHDGSATYFTSFMWSPLGGSSLAEKGLHEETPVPRDLPLGSGAVRRVCGVLRWHIDSPQQEGSEASSFPVTSEAGTAMMP